MKTETALTWAELNRLRGLVTKERARLRHEAGAGGQRPSEVAMSLAQLDAIHDKLVDMEEDA